MLSPLRYKRLVGDALRTIADSRRELSKVRASQGRLKAEQARLLAEQGRLERLVTKLGNDLDRQGTKLGNDLERQGTKLGNDLERQVTKLSNQLVRLQDAIVTQHEIVATNTAAFDDYKGAFQGRDVVIVASGPTLDYYEPIPDAIHIGVNAVIGSDRIPHDIHFAQDFGGGGGLERVLRLYDNGRVPKECKLFLGLVARTPYRGIEASESFAMRLGATRYFKEIAPSQAIYRDIRFHPLMDFYTVVFSALHFALFTTPRRIYLVGCDTSYFGHFDGSPQRETDEQVRKYLTNRLQGYRRAREFARTWYTETEIISVNPVNLAGLFADTFTTDADYRRSQHHAPLVEGDYSDEAIRDFVEQHIVEVRSASG